MSEKQPLDHQDDRFLVTGAMGCIGAWVVRNLVRQGVPTTVFDVASDPHRMRLIMSEDELSRVNMIAGDVSDLAAVEAAVKDSGATYIIHLAGLQVPFCRADPSLGARVNVVGTVNIFEAAKKAGVQRVVYASSAAVYGKSEDYPEGPLANDAPQHPNNLYGVYKQANEGTARIYWQDYGMTSIGLRPYTVYGPGRDQGMTSGPTKAMLAAAQGQSYHIPFGGRCGYQFTDDTANIFIESARVPYKGTECFNLGGSFVYMSDIVDAIHAVVPSAKITYESTSLALPEVMDAAPLAAVLGTVPETALDQGVKMTIDIFRQALAEGRLKV